MTSVLSTPPEYPTTTSPISRRSSRRRWYFASSAGGSAGTVWLRLGMEPYLYFLIFALNLLQTSEHVILIVLPSLRGCGRSSRWPFCPFLLQKPPSWRHYASL